MESKLRALNKFNQKAEWLCHFKENISSGEKHVSLICIHCNSQSTIRMVQSHIYMVSLDIYGVDILNNSQWVLSILTT